MMKTKCIGYCKTKHNFTCITLMLCIVFLSAITSSAGFPGVLAINSQSADTEQIKPVAGLEEDVQSAEKTDFFSKNTLISMQLFLENYSQLAYWRLTILNINKTRLLYDLKKTFRTLAGISGFSSVSGMLSLLFVVFATAAALAWLFWRFVLKRLRPEFPAADLPWQWKLWFGLISAVPEFFAILFFTVASYIVYVLFYSSYFSIICPFYLTVLLTSIVIWTAILISKTLFSPAEGQIRLVPWDDETARTVHRINSIFISVIIIGVMSVRLLKYGGLKGDSLVIIKFIFGTISILIIGLFLLLNRKIISRKMFSSSEKSGAIWFHKQFAKSWLYLLEFYLFILWLIWSERLLLSDSHFTLAFFVSLLIIPVFFICDNVTGWFFRFFGSVISVDHDEITETDQEKKSIDDQPDLLHSYLRSLSRLVLASLLLFWLLHLWGIENSYTPLVVAATKKVIFIVFIFVVLWRLIDKIINNLLSGDGEMSVEEDEGGESEWGGAPLLDRTQTLLPIVRKFLGIVMIVMLSLFTLSSLGVNIGPLLAGAGVVGIAIGFGAQKLVSDLLSGFFYLIDDAFRVGEYIEASSISGSVEKITLRNVMLRHHRGMLQIVPYGDLGAITNYMRGGIVVKFNLQFPYDTDVDQVRKIIKRVGIAMLDDPALGKDFIKQIKSQGIREVGDSVLTIRVKFTANPGTHFVIRREAFRRITEALTKKGIHYAHRKVIVEVPGIAKMEGGGNQISDEVKQQIAAAGGAAAIETQKKSEE